jgi:hypothetical protein
MHYFSFSTRPGAVFIKKRAGTRYAKIVFLHPVRSAGHVVHAGASRARNIDAPFSCSRWPGAVSTKSTLGHVTLNFCFLHLVSSVGHVVHFGMSEA